MRLSGNRIITELELLQTFPQAKVIIPAKIRELMDDQQLILDDIELTLQRVRETDPANIEMWEHYLLETRSFQFVAIDRHISRLRRIENILRGRSGRSTKLTPAMVEAAKAVPIENIVGIELKRAGKLLRARCPLHEEQTPSFYVYPETNSFNCFGCTRGGDVISLIQYQRGLTFPAAVQYLVGGAR